jgi:hypothetical protein
MVTDAQTINAQLDALYTDEQKIVDILKTYDTQEKFDQMLIKYKEVNGKELGPELGRAFTLPEDRKEIDDLQNFLATIGYASMINKFSFTNFLKVDDKTAATNSGSYDGLRRAKEIKNTVCTAEKGTVEGRPVITIGPAKGNDLLKWAERYGVTNQEIEDARKSCGKKNSSAAGGSTSKPKYTPCEAGKYVRGCKSDVVKKVQACLEMPSKYHTGNFGPITQGELQKKFPELAQGFTDADVTKICSKTVTPVKPIQPKG